MAISQTQKYEVFKALHERPGAFLIPNPWNAGTAMMLAALGYEALATTSAGLGFSIGRRSSAAALTREAILDNAREIVEATDLPVSADLEDGFGVEPETCAETIRLAANVGLVGGSIEDATGNPGDPIFPFELAVERVAAACEAAKGLPFSVTARAENLLHGWRGVDETIRRLQAYSAAGADVLYAPGLPDIEAIRDLCQSVDKPVNVVMGLTGPLYSVEELAAAGVKRISVGGAFARAALGGFIRAAREVKETGTFTFAAEAMPGTEINRYMMEAKRG